MIERSKEGELRRRRAGDGSDRDQRYGLTQALTLNI